MQEERNVQAHAARLGWVEALEKLGQVATLVAERHAAENVAELVHWADLAIPKQALTSEHEELPNQCWLVLDRKFVQDDRRCNDKPDVSRQENLVDHKWSVKGGVLRT